MFVGNFTLEAAQDIVASAAIDQLTVLGAIDSLVAKSMVATNRVGTTMRYRLLDTTRTYARAITSTRPSTPTWPRATRFTIGDGWSGPSPNGRSCRTRRDGRRALPISAMCAPPWNGAFGTKGDVALGIGLATAAAPVFLAMSLLTECHRWSERAIAVLDDAARAGSEEMQLQAALGLSLMFTRGSTEGARTAFERSLAIAEERGDAFDRLQRLGPLHMFHVRIGDFATALHHARRSAAISESAEDQAALALSHSLLGISLHLIGDPGGARVALETALRGPRVPHGPSAIHLGFDHHNWAGIALARTLWLQRLSGSEPRNAPAGPSRTPRRWINPVTLAIALNWAISLSLWIGDLPSAEEYLDWFAAAPHPTRWALTSRSDAATRASSRSAGAM